MIRFANSVQSEFKVIFCGDCTVGKTSLIQKICFDAFYENTEQTCQMDYFQKKVSNGEKSVNLGIWDTLGQEK